MEAPTHAHLDAVPEIGVAEEPQPVPARPREARRRDRRKLPPELPRFVGRTREVAEVRRLLGQARLVTLTGPGGIGKTRLALRTAEQMQKVFADGVWLVDLASLKEPRLLCHTFTEALGVSVEPGTCSAVDVLIDFLADKSLLMIIDNCEHVLDECAELLNNLLVACPTLRVMMGSRESLRINGEHLMMVPSLPVPHNTGSSCADLMECESVDLFLDRARGVLPEFTVTDANRATIASIVRRLEGIPLAIELAASELSALSLTQLSNQIDDVFRLPTAANRATLPRQRTLRAMTDWSYELCSSDEQTLWSRLATFSGSFDVEAAQRVCGPGLAKDVLDVLPGLVDKSVLVHEQYGANSCYRQMRIQREYGWEKLAESGEEGLLRRRHLDYFHELAVRLGSEWSHGRQVAALTQMELEQEEFRAALHSCLADAGHERTGLEIAAALAPYWHSSGHRREGLQWLKQLLDADQEPSLTRAAALRAAGLLAVTLGDTSSANLIINEFHSLARRLVNAPLIAWAKTLSGILGLFSEAVEATAHIEEARAQHCANGDKTGIMFTEFYLGNAALRDKDLDRAQVHYQQSRTISEMIRDSWQHAETLLALGMLAGLQGDAGRAAELERQAIRLKLDFHDYTGIGQCTELIAWTSLSQGHPERAAQLLGARRTLRQHGGVSLYTHLFSVKGLETEVCRNLGRSKFEANYSKGTKLDLNSMVSLTLDESPLTSTSPQQTQPIPDFTQREAEIAALIAQGMSNKAIAAQLVISPRTAEAHVDHILTKLGFNSRYQVAAWVAKKVGHRGQLIAEQRKTAK